MFSFLVHFYDLIVIWRTPILLKQLSAVASKQKEDNKFTKFFVIVILCLSLFLFLLHKLPPSQFLFILNFKNIFGCYLRK